MKRPFELAISAIRTLGAETNGGPQLHQWIASMGEPLYRYQTPNGYSDTAESWVNTGGLLERLNFGLALASNRIPGTRVDLKRFAGEWQAGRSVDKVEVMDRFLKVIVGGRISPKTRETLLKQLDQEIAVTSATTELETAKVADDAMEGQQWRNGMRAKRTARPAATGPGGREMTDPVTRIVGLILGSPEFQRQ